MMSTFNELQLDLDPYNFEDEIKFHLFNEDINREDLLDLLSEGLIDVNTFCEANAYCDYLEEV